MARDVPSSTKRLRAQAKRAGLDDVTENRIKRWKRDGLLPPARRKGVKGRGGTTSYYPPGTLAQVRELRTLLDDDHYPRDIDKAAVLLFLRGYTVTEHALRRALANLLSGFLSPVTGAGSPEQAARAVRRRHVSDSEATRLGDDDLHERALRSSVEPFFAMLDPAALNRWLAILQADPLRPLLDEGAPIIVDLARGGHLEPTRFLSDLIPNLTLDSFRALAIALSGIVYWIEREWDFVIEHQDQFINECLSELRRPLWKRDTIRIIESLDKGDT